MKEKKEKFRQMIFPGVIYNGSRGNDFKEIIASVLKLGKIKQTYIDILTNEDSLKYYNLAFTSTTADKVNNYEVYEQLGDVSAGNFIVWYMYNRFPQLRCVQGVQVVSVAKANYGSKKSFYKIAEDLGFWPFISALVEQRDKQKKKLLEDVFESFLGVTEELLDKQTRHGVGYCIIYDILTVIFDQIPISLKYEDMVDAKTRLKELFDVNKHLGTITYIDTRVDNFAHSQVMLIPPENELLDFDTQNYIKSLEYQIEQLTRKIDDIRFKFPKHPIGDGKASIKPDAQQQAAAAALEYLEQMNYKKKIPEEYLYFEELEKQKASN